MSDTIINQSSTKICEVEEYYYESGSGKQVVSFRCGPVDTYTPPEYPPQPDPCADVGCAMSGGKSGDTSGCCDDNNLDAPYIINPDKPFYIPKEIEPDEKGGKDNRQYVPNKDDKY